MTDSHDSEHTGTRVAEDAHLAEETHLAEHDAAIARHKRLVLTAAAATFLLFMAFPVTTSFTGALDGVVHGIGIGYAAGLAVIVAPVLAAIAYRRWAARPGRGVRR
ncbi:DUF485 domain-containing protein [Actinomadura graeca]|uniref:DUF485 domain-containing protein n=1 Tax=Actinomadura graeca TaxID=2750812 RepID=A0ABX8QQR9_9ACTN|nr:DUF485 domain-containing protein [Actinomadura graeca]QXJ20289.1 DUF485 domain-containing protein [Actinomadura graeca]